MHDVEYPKELFVKDFEYLPRIVYHILRHTLWPIKGNSPDAKLEGAMKTLVFYIISGIRFNTQDYFFRRLGASGIDLFGLKFYTPWVMRLIKRHSTVNYQPSARNHVVSFPDVHMSYEAIYPMKISLFQVAVKGLTTPLSRWLQGSYLFV